ncbi:class I SAM-dependent methyltransferase [Geodermatophilus sp. SYSU D00815]
MPTAVPAAFVRAHTRPTTPSLVPEVTLHVADDVVALWDAMEAEGVPSTSGEGLALPPFWCAAWPGGQVLARHVLDAPAVVTGRRVLDLGSGSGLVAIAAALAGAGEVVASEIDAYGQAAIGVNAEANGVAGIRVVGNLLDGPPPAVDVVLAGDVCYERAMTERVLPFLDRARAAGADVYIGDPGRAYLPSDRLTEVAAHDVPETEGPGIRRTTVWRYA